MTKIEYFNHCNAAIGYRDKGEGPALVLIHGTGGDGEANWSGVAESLSGRRILRPDYAGSGLTKDPATHLTLDHIADQVLAAVNHAGVATFDLAGFSLGAAVAIRIAARHPERVTSLVSLGGFANGGDPRSLMMFDHWIDLARRDPGALARLMLLSGFTPEYVAGMGDLDVVVSAMIDTMNWTGVALQAELDKSVDITADLNAVTARTLVLGNRRDQMVAPSASITLAEGIAGARLDWIDGPHLSPMEMPETVARILAKFFSDIS